MKKEFKLPELGENIETANVVKVLVSPGQSVSKDQAVLELETDKATIEVPSPVEGVVQEVQVKEGEKARVGQSVMTIEASDGQGSAGRDARATELSAPDAEKPKAETKPKTEEKPRTEQTPKAEQKPPEPRAQKAQPQAAAGRVEMKLPELGENIESASVVRVLVSPGDRVEKDQSVMELETDKATIEVPSPAAGMVKEVLVKAGEKASVGQTIMIVESGAAAPSAQQPPAEQKKKEPTPKQEKMEERVMEAQTGPSAEQVEEVAEKVVEPEGEALPSPSSSPSPAGRERVGSDGVEPLPIPAIGEEKPAAAEYKPPARVAPASPSVRRFAREIGIDINQVPGTGPRGRISAEDVKRYSRKMRQQPAPISPLSEALPDFERWGEVNRTPMSSIRLKTAEHMAVAWSNIPQVTQFDKADITKLESLRKKFASKAETTGGKLTVTAVLIRVAASALKTFPQFNASIDLSRHEVIYKKYYHIGVAVDTDRGLLVPVIRDADKKNILQITTELGQLAEKARNKKLSPEEMQGGTFTVTNLGGIGGTYFSPIVNYPEVAILGVSRSGIEPLHVDGAFVPRTMLPLSLSYDHRLIDGATAARFLRWIAAAVEDPFLLALEG